MRDAKKTKSDTNAQRRYIFASNITYNAQGKYYSAEYQVG